MSVSVFISHLCWVYARCVGPEAAIALHCLFMRASRVVVSFGFRGILDSFDVTHSFLLVMIRSAGPSYQRIAFVYIPLW